MKNKKLTIKQGGELLQAGITPDKFRKCRKKYEPLAVEMPMDFEVYTKEGIMQGKEGDFLIIGQKGEFYPCDREIFFNTYEWSE